MEYFETEKEIFCEIFILRKRKDPGEGCFIRKAGSLRMEYLVKLLRS